MAHMEALRRIGRAGYSDLAYLLFWLRYPDVFRAIWAQQREPTISTLLEEETRPFTVNGQVAVTSIANPTGGPTGGFPGMQINLLTDADPRSLLDAINPDDKNNVPIGCCFVVASRDDSVEFR